MRFRPRRHPLSGEEMHIGPVRGREATLDCTAKGIIIATMIQAEALVTAR